MEGRFLGSSDGMSGEVGVHGFGLSPNTIASPACLRAPFRPSHIM